MQLPTKSPYCVCIRCILDKCTGVWVHPLKYYSTFTRECRYERVNTSQYSLKPADYMSREQQSSRFDSTLSVVSNN